MTYIAVRIASKEYKAKQKAEYQFVRGDQHFGPRTILKLTTVAFCAAFASGFSGIAPGTMYNSFFVQLDMHPKVSAATANHSTLFATLAATTTLLLSDSLNLPYAMLIDLCVIAGTIPGLFLQNWVIRTAGGRIQFSVAILLGFLILPIVTVLPLSLLEAKRASDNGVDTTEFKAFCE